MQQVLPFNQTKAGKIKNWCLRNVIMGYSIPAKYPDAWTAWLNTEQHTGTPPVGLDVPVYFSYTATIDGITKNWGHIGVRLKNGKFWSDGITYETIAAYTANHFPRYVGWGESINEVKVLKEEDVLTSREDAIWLYRVTMGIHSPTEAQKRGWTGKELTPLLKAIRVDKRHINYVNNCDVTVNDEAVKQSLKDKITNLIKGVS